MRFTIIILIFGLLGVSQYSWSQDSIVKYYTSDWKKAKANNYHYKRVVFKESKKKWCVKDYFKNDQLQGVSHYRNRRLTKPVDTFKLFYEDGQLLSSFSYNLEGQLHGAFQSFYPEGGIDKSKNYENGKLDGGQTWHYRNGDVSWYEYYRNDSLVFIQTFNEKGEELNYKVQEYYRPIWNDTSYQDCADYISKNLTYVRDIVVIRDVTLYIDLNGKVIHAEFVDGKGGQEEIIKLLLNGPLWRPGRDHLRPWNTVIEVRLSL